MGQPQTRTWGQENFTKAPITDSLSGIVKQLPPNVKQAMYAAANKGLIKRGTWDGCAFNAAGHEVQKVVTNSTRASDIFQVPIRLVDRFIQIWDDIEGTDEECTERLKQALLEAGLFSDPNESRSRRVLRQTVYKSQETQMREQFEAIVEGLDLDDNSELANNVNAVSELLSV